MPVGLAHLAQGILYDGLYISTHYTTPQSYGSHAQVHSYNMLSFFIDNTTPFSSSVALCILHVWCNVDGRKSKSILRSYHLLKTFLLMYL